MFFNQLETYEICQIFIALISNYKEPPAIFHLHDFKIIVILCTGYGKRMPLDLWGNVYSGHSAFHTR